MHIHIIQLVYSQPYNNIFFHQSNYNFVLLYNIHQILYHQFALDPNKNRINPYITREKNTVHIKLFPLFLSSFSTYMQLKRIPNNGMKNVEIYIHGSGAFLFLSDVGSIYSSNSPPHVVQIVSSVSWTLMINLK